MSRVLSGKNIIVTGTSRGLGKHIAEAMWREGANLLLVARSEDALNDLRQTLAGSANGNQTVWVVAADLGQPNAIDRITAKAREFPDGLDALVNNAAIQGPIGPLSDNDPAEWATTIAVNLTAPVMLCRACIPLMTEPHPPAPSPNSERVSRVLRDEDEVNRERSRGKIINISGGGATGPRPNFTAYASAKAALVRFSETIALEVPQIDINCIAPGAIGTRMTEAVLKAGAERAGSREFEGAQKLMTSGTDNATRAAALCVFLASNDSDGITGKLISAVWDSWATLPQHLDDLRTTDIYTLRRIVPEDRQKDWSKT